MRVFSDPPPVTTWPRVPTRVLTGRDDRFFPAAFQRRIAEERLGITPDELPGGHLLALSRPVELADLLAGYWAEVDGVRAARPRSRNMPRMTAVENLPATGIQLRGLVKSFRTPDGLVQAVREVDIEIGAGETLALLGPNGAGKSTTIDMLLGLTKPDTGSVTLFGLAPADAIRAGRVGAMLQTGGLLRDLSVRELIEMMAIAPPRAARHRRGARGWSGSQGIAGQRTQTAVRRRDAARPVRDRAGQRPRPARARRADGGDGRRGPDGLLGDDARASRPAARRSCSRRTTSRRPTPTPTGPC